MPKNPTLTAFFSVYVICYIVYIDIIIDNYYHKYY